tara:strand:- start:3680 stop:5896 length:2217 start_codon:yes stop_codon:yes gene_type:complete
LVEALPVNLLSRDGDPLTLDSKRFKMASPYGMFSLGTNISERPRNYKYKDDDEDTSGPYVPLLERVAPRLYQSTREDINWVNNPPKGHAVVTGRGRDENAAIESAIAGTDSPLDTHIEKEGNEFVAYALIEDSVLGGRPEEAMLDTYEQPGLELEEEEEEGIAWGAIGPEAENRRRLKRRGLYPELQLEEQKRQDEASATPGLDPNLPDEFYPSAALRGKYLEEDEDRALEDKLLQLSSEPSVTDSGFDLPAKTAPGLNIPPYISEEKLAKMPLSERIRYRKSRLRSVGAGENLPPDTPTGKTNEELREQMRVQDQRVAPPRPIEPMGQAETRLMPDDVDSLPMDLDEDMAPRNKLLQVLSGLGGGIAGLGGDIGRWAKDNPELVMAGLQTIGELGGQYKRSRREQEASDAEDQERRMSTAISALTRGRVTPEVGRRAPRTTTGEGIFDVMAGIGRGGQQFLEAKRGRDEREEAMEMYRADRARTQRIEDAERDRRTKREDAKTQQEIDQFNKNLDLERYKAQTGRMKTEGELLGNIGNLAPDESGNLSPERWRQIDAVLTRLEEHNENPVFGTTLGQTGMGPGVGDVASRAIWEVAPTGGQRAAVLNPQYFDRLTTEIVFRVLKPLSEEGRLTKDDFENLRDMAGRASDDINLRRQLTKNIREALETKLKPVGTYPRWGLGGGKAVGGQVQVEEEVGVDNDPQNIELTEAQEALIFLADKGDEEALEELRRMGLIGN